MKIGELSRRTGLSTHTIRYYESIGLLPTVDRNAAQHRDYDSSMLGWFVFLGHLKATGMPLSEMCHYAALRAGGDSTIAERRVLLQKHALTVEEKLQKLKDNLELLNKKINAYQIIEDEMERGLPIPDKGWEKHFQKLAKS